MPARAFPPTFFTSTWRAARAKTAVAWATLVQAEASEKTSGKMVVPVATGLGVRPLSVKAVKWATQPG